MSTVNKHENFDFQLIQIEPPKFKNEGITGQMCPVENCRKMPLNYKSLRQHVVSVAINSFFEFPNFQMLKDLQSFSPIECISWGPVEMRNMWLAFTDQQKAENN